MDFGKAIKALKAGKKVARKGWNGKGMFLFLVTGSSIPKENLRNEARKAMETVDKSIVEICPHIDMKAVDGSIQIGWSATQSDMLANDWEVI